MQTYESLHVFSFIFIILCYITMFTVWWETLSFWRSEQQWTTLPRLKFSRGSITLNTKNEDWAVLSTEVKPWTEFNILMILKQYDASKWVRETFQIIGESNEFFEGKEFLFVDKINNTCSTSLKDTKSIWAFISATPDIKIKRKSVVYLYNKEMWIVKAYLRLTQSIPMVNNRYQFGKPFANWIDAIQQEHWNNLPWITFGIGVETTNDIMPTSYPIFIKKDTVIDPKVIQASIDEAYEIVKQQTEYMKKRYLKDHFDTDTVLEEVKETKQETKQEVKQSTPFVEDDLPF